MSPEWRAAFLAHAQSPGYRRAVAEARRALDAVAHRHVVVPFSGGKDSTVLLHLAAAHCPELLVTHFDFGRPGQKRYNAFPAGLERTILDNGRAISGHPVHVITKHKYWSDPDGAEANRPAGTMIHYIPDSLSWIVGSIGIARQYGCGINLVALRKAESRRRSRRIEAGQTIRPDVIDERWPLADWSDRDVWAYLVEHDLPYPAIYDERAAVLGDYLGVRLTSLFRDPTEAKADSTAMDGILNWRDRNAPR